MVLAMRGIFIGNHNRRTLPACEQHGSGTMDEVTRGELEKLHARINDMKERLVTLEAQQPHINAALLRIEGSVGKLADRIRNALWALLVLVLSPLAVLLVKAFASGALSTHL